MEKTIATMTMEEYLILLHTDLAWNLPEFAKDEEDPVDVHNNGRSDSNSLRQQQKMQKRRRRHDTKRVCRRRSKSDKVYFGKSLHPDGFYANHSTVGRFQRDRRWTEITKPNQISALVFDWEKRSWRKGEYDLEAQTAEIDDYEPHSMNCDRKFMDAYLAISDAKEYADRKRPNEIVHAALRGRDWVTGEYISIRVQKGLLAILNAGLFQRYIDRYSDDSWSFDMPSIQQAMEHWSDDAVNPSALIYSASGHPIVEGHLIFDLDSNDPFITSCLYGLWEK